MPSGITSVDPKALISSGQEFGYHADTMKGVTETLQQYVKSAGNFWGSNPEDTIAQMFEDIYPAYTRTLIEGTAAAESNLRSLADGIASTGGLFGQSSVVNNAAVNAAVGGASVGRVK